MFEGFFDSVSVIRIAAQGDTQKLKKLINAGCRLDQRSGSDPWRTPLDEAVISGNLECVAMLLSGGAPIIGSAIYEAIVKDSKEVLDIFAKKDNSFYQKFHFESPSGALNP